MIYTLPNGQNVDLAKVTNVSRIRDMGHDSKSIDKQKIGFTISLKNREIIDVVDYYHYSDWADVKNRLNLIRKQVIAKWEQEKDE